MIETFLYGKRGMRVSVASIRPCYMLCIRVKAGTSFYEGVAFGSLRIQPFPIPKKQMITL